MKFTVSEALTWAVIELQTPKPRFEQIREILELVIPSALSGELDKATLRHNLIRMAQITGADHASL